MVYKTSLWTYSHICVPLAAVCILRTFVFLLSLLHAQLHCRVGAAAVAERAHRTVIYDKTCNQTKQTGQEDMFISSKYSLSSLPSGCKFTQDHAVRRQADKLTTDIKKRRCLQWTWTLDALLVATRSVITVAWAHASIKMVTEKCLIEVSCEDERMITDKNAYRSIL